MPPRSTPLLGFKPPFVKDGEIVLPVLTGTGEWAELTATPATWQRIALALALHWTPKPARTASPAAAQPTPAPKPICVRVDPARPHTPAPRPPIAKPSGRIL